LGSLGKVATGGVPVDAERNLSEGGRFVPAPPRLAGKNDPMTSSMQLAGLLCLLVAACSGRNLDVTCGGFPSASADKLLLNIGNGSYDGPATYDIDSTLAHGAVTLTIATSEYSAAAFSAGCVVDLTTAPPGNDAPSGSSIAGTFSCTGLTTEQQDASIDIAGGAFNRTVR